jgi:hypothetical protein
LHSRSGGAAGSRGASAVTGLLLTRPRKAFGAQMSLSDAPASDLWASNTMEVSHATWKSDGCIEQ